jgi:DNA invertase Pin-like site-specific DNA recombinase
MRIVTQTRFPKAQLPKLTRVAAYARVSSGKDAMLHSLSAQVSYYSNLIQNHSGWQYVGVYADEALTGTKDNRENFQRLLTDCRSGKVDMIITKSISRFARNTVTLLETVRELKNMGVDVFFEEQNIHSLSADGELMLTILASYAQEESLSASENQKWRVKQKFSNGQPWRTYMLGYRYDGEQLVIVPEEAEIVRSIFADYLDGKGVVAIMKRLNEEGILTQQGFTWHQSAVQRVLRNYTYTGNLLLQTKFRENHLTKRTVVNRGELPQYHIQNCHEPIIDMDTYKAVQIEMAHRADQFGKPQATATYPFTGLITCAGCGKHYRRKMKKTGPVWICSTYNTLGKAACQSKAIPESVLIDIVDEIGGIGNLTAIQAANNNTLVLTLTSGQQIVKQWLDRSRRESWTPEMREAARQRKMRKEVAS